MNRKATWGVVLFMMTPGYIGLAQVTLRPDQALEGVSPFLPAIEAATDVKALA